MQNNFFLTDIFFSDNLSFFDRGRISSAFRQRSRLPASNASTFVTRPMPFVRPSRKRILVPTLMYSGLRMNLNSTVAVSLLFIPSVGGKIFSMTAVCLTLPTWTVVRNPAKISFGWYKRFTLAVKTLATWTDSSKIWI